jgi:hypothetical protein
MQNSFSQITIQKMTKGKPHAETLFNTMTYENIVKTILLITLLKGYGFSVHFRNKKSVKIHVGLHPGNVHYRKAIAISE